MSKLNFGHFDRCENQNEIKIWNYPKNPEILKSVFIVQVLKERHYNNTLSKIGIFVEFVAFFYQPVVVAAKRRIRRVFRS